MKPLILFSWGYWGWGNATPQWIRAVDAVEGAQGFKPPLFVDIRISRAVRAPGFNGTAFAETAGESRYRWMNSLGNVAILARRGGTVEIKDPAAAEDLLDLALEMGREERRIIFFCACELPGRVGQEGACHRVTVARLVLQAARRRGIHLEIVEWPGGEPRVFDIEVASADYRKLIRGGRSIPLQEGAALAEMASVPWGSIVRVHSPEGAVPLVTGPAKYGQDEWYLPVPFETADPEVPLATLQARAATWRRESGYEGVRA